MTTPVPAGSARSGPYDWLAEAALASVTVVSAVGMNRLFADSSFLRDVLFLGLASHLVAIAARRAGLSTLGAALLSAGCFVITVTALRYTDTAWLVLPTSDTFWQARDHVVEGWRMATIRRAPVPADPGVVVLTGAAIWAAALGADTVAFRARGFATALSPGVGLLIFTAVAGVEEGRSRHAALFCAAAAATLVALRLRERNRDRWVEARPGRGTRALARAAVAAAAVAVLVGSTFGPTLPGAEASPWVDIGGLDDAGGSRVVLSPLVQIRSRLVERSDEELFTVAVGEESRQYWRLMSLDEFDGESWRARSQFEAASGLLQSAFDPSVEGASLEQAVSIAGLDNDYLPAARELRRVVDDGGVPLEFEAASGALIRADSSAGGPRRFTYTVESVLVSIDDPDVLRGSNSVPLDPEFLAFNTELPQDASDLVRAEAQRVTAGSDSDYRRALDLQDYFWLDGRFSYDLGVHESHGIEDLEDFLFEVRAGYCEQFASAYAVMARSIGLPTRMAVGFTWGEWDPERGVYAVRGEHAHAWPEVYFEGIGWVRFEPTPGRGAPDDFAVTGRVADQANFDPEVVVAVPEWEAPVAEGSGFAGLDQAIPEPSDGPGGRAVQRSRPTGSPTSAVGGRLVLAAAAVAAIGLAAGAVPALRHLHRQRRRSRLANDPHGLVDAAWGDVLAALEMIGLGPGPADTPLELAERVRSATGAAGPVDEMAVLATQGRYAETTTFEMAERAGVTAARVVSACRRRASLRRRLATAFNPSTVFS